MPSTVTCRSSIASSSAAWVLGVGTAVAVLLVVAAGWLTQREIQRRSRMELELRDTSSLQRAVLDSANYGIVSTSTDGVITTFNRGAERILGY